MIGITVLGSTGSIGVSTLDVLGRHGDTFELIALTANKDINGLYAQCVQWRPRFAVMADSKLAAALQARLHDKVPETTVLAGPAALETVAALPEVDYVMAAIVGAAGLLPTLAAANAGKRVLLANKESLVMSGRLFMDAVKNNGAELLPIDSEHNAVFQCMPAGFGSGLDAVGVTRVLLTASGGPFRDTPLAQLHNVTADQACAHPNWDMGRKISVDSATMMNKGLEVIEACWLFGTTAERVEVVLHPQSVIHSLVEYSDGSVLAQLGNPDMRTPIAHALAWPKRMASGVERLDLFAVARLDFSEPDSKRFPCLQLARDAMQMGGTATTILNAANEVAVALFLDAKIRFTEIAEIVARTLDTVNMTPADTLDMVLDADARARESALATAREVAA